MKIEGWDELEQPRQLAFGYVRDMDVVDIDGEQFGITIEEAIEMSSKIFECAVRAKINKIAKTN